MKKAMIVLLSLIFILMLPACGNETKENKITVCLDWTPNINHVGLYVAKNLGYFKELGLEIEIVQPDVEMAPQVVASGKAQFGIDAQDTMAAAIAGENGMEITAVAAILQHNTSGILSRKGEGIDRPAGMTGRTYSTWDSPVEQGILKYLVNKDGGDFSKIKLVPNVITDESAALSSMQTDCLWVFYGVGGIKAEMDNVSTDYFAVSEINPVFDYYTPVIIANNDFLNNSTETAKAFLKALSKGYEYSYKNPDRAAEILISEVPEIGDSGYIKAGINYISKYFLNDEGRWGKIDAGRWNSFYRWMNENNLIEGKLSDNQGFSNDFTE